MPEPSIHVCPLCATYVEVEGDYDGPHYVWGCEHGSWDREPLSVPVFVFQNSELLEAARSAACAAAWVELRHACALERVARDKRDYSILTHALDLTYTPADRRARHEFRHANDQFNRVLKHVYAEPIREALHRGSVFLAASLAESRDAHIQAHRAICRIAYGDDSALPG